MKSILIFIDILFKVEYIQHDESVWEQGSIEIENLYIKQGEEWKKFSKENLTKKFFRSAITCIQMESYKSEKSIDVK